MALLEQFFVDLFVQLGLALLQNLPSIAAAVNQANQTTIVTAPPLPKATTDAINLELTHAILAGDVPAPGVVIHA